MAIEVKIENLQTHLLVVSKGVGESYETILDYATKVVNAALENKSKKILCDERELIYKISTFDIYKLAEFAAQYSNTTEKIALVSAEANVIDGRFYETVSQNRGLTIRVIPNMDEAKIWLDI